MKLFEKYKLLANKIFLDYVLKNKEKFRKFYINYQKARIPILFETYVSVMYLTTFLAFIIVFIFVLIYMRFTIGFWHWIEWLVSVTVALIFSLAVYVYFKIYPSLRAGDLRVDIENNLPFALLYMAALAKSGLPPQKIFEILAKRSEFGGITEEAKYITYLIKVMGLDLISALVKAANTSPSRKFSEFLYSFISTIRSGGDLKFFLENEAKNALFEFKLKVKEFTDKLSTLLTIYTGIFVVFPLFLITLITLFAMLINIKILPLLKLMLISILPLFNMSFLLLLQTYELKR